MNIAEKIIISGDVDEQTKNDLAYLLMNFKAENPKKEINKANFIIKCGLESVGYTEADFTLSESENFIRLEVSNVSISEEEKNLSSVI